MRQIDLNDLISRELFDQVDIGLVEGLVETSRLCKLNRGQQLKASRAGTDYLYVIVSGYLAIWLSSELVKDGWNFLAWRGPEQIIGEMKVIGDLPTNDRILCCDPCTFVELRSEQLAEAANQTPAIYRNIARLLIRKLRTEWGRFETIQINPARRKIAQALICLATERRENFNEDLSKGVNVARIPGKLLQKDLAGYVGESRVRVNQHLNFLRDTGCITFSHSSYKITDIRALQEIALNYSDSDSASDKRGLTMLPGVDWQV